MLEISALSRLAGHVFSVRAYCSKASLRWSPLQEIVNKNFNNFDFSSTFPLLLSE